MSLQQEARQFGRWIGILMALLALVAVSPVSAGWLTRLAKEAGEAGSDAGKLGAAKTGLAGLDSGVLVLRSIPDSPDAVRLAAHATPEGHWSFANRNGDVFTAADPEEMGRLVQSLAPDAASSGKAGSLALYLDETTVFKHRDRIDALPDNARLYVTVDGKPYRLVRRGDGATARFSVRMRRNVEVPMGNRALFDEAVWQLSRRLNKADIRVVALDEKGADALRGVPVFDKGTQQARVDRLKPDQLMQSFRDVRGQTVLLKGRVDGDQFVVTPSGGSQRQIPIADLTSSAARHDVNVVLLQGQGVQQPGGRNWFWQTVEVDGLKDAVKRATYADFLNALGEKRGMFSVRAQAQGEGRVLVQATPVTDASSVPYGDVVGDIGDWVGHVTSQVTGNVITNAVTASVNSKERQTELDWRLVPHVPSIYQLIYLAGIVCGLLSWAITRSWWRYVWKREARAEYASTFGYFAARIVKALFYTFVFLPLVGIPAFAVQCLLVIWGWVTLPYRMVAWIVRKVRPQAA